MNKQNKIILKSAIISGLVYGTLMAGFDFVDRQNFNLWKFFFNAMFFGFFTGLLTRYSFLKQK